jgi:Fur family transcriptional regulator, iron response regulator
MESPEQKSQHLHSRESVINLLREHNISPTHQRVEIAYALFSKQHHLSAEQLLGNVNQEYALASKATVYNTLNLFVEKKLIREVIVDPSKVFYDPNTNEHHHFYDTVTGELTDIPSASISLTAMPVLPQGTVADGIDIIIRTRPA